MSKENWCAAMSITAVLGILLISGVLLQRSHDRFCKSELASQHVKQCAAALVTIGAATECASTAGCAEKAERYNTPDMPATLKVQAE